MAAVTFNYTEWAARFPELAVPEAVANRFFTDVTMGGLLDNTDCSPIADVTRRAIVLDYAVAHLAKLAGYPILVGATVPEPVATVGRVSSASEGSVSVSLDYGQMRENQAWWCQTQYGATFWQMTRIARTARYVPGPRRYFGPAYGRIGFVR